MIKPKIARRTFLLLGSAFSLGLISPIARQWWQSQLNQKADDEVELTSVEQQLAIAFWQPDQTLQRSDASFVSNLVAADRLRTGDRAFIKRGARVLIQGMQFDEKGWSDHLRSLMVHAYYPGNSSHSEQKVCVWCLQITPVLNHPAANRFLIPVAKTGLKLSLAQTVTNASEVQAGAPAEALTHFTVSNQANQLKLRRGMYVIANALPDGKLPDWQDYQLRRVEGLGTGGGYKLWRRDRAGDSPIAATFPYLLIAVDYADANAAILI